MSDVLFEGEVSLGGVLAINSTIEIWSENMTVATQLDALATQVGSDVNAINVALAVLVTTDGDHDAAVASLNTSLTSLTGAHNALQAAHDAIDLTSVIDDINGGNAVTFSANKIAALIIQAKDDAVAAVQDGADITADTLSEVNAFIAANTGGVAQLILDQSHRIRSDAPMALLEPAKAQARSNMDAASVASVAAVSSDLGNVAGMNAVSSYNTAKNAA